MQNVQINHNADLRKLQEDNYKIGVCEAHAFIENVPYVNSNQEIKYGTLVSTLNINGAKLMRPDTHVIYFQGEHPCNKDGSIIAEIKHSSGRYLLSGIEAQHAFSNKPQGGYPDYYQKFKRYIEIISAPAISLNPSVTARSNELVESNYSSVFNYLDTNSSRAGITESSDRLLNQKIGIIGVGGTGSYILDFVAKTPVKEIHLIDGDIFMQHNAFRAPGAPELDKFNEEQCKADYLHEIYSKMHKGVFAHPEYLSSQNIDILSKLDYVFICVDKGSIKKTIINHLIEKNISFIDVGMGVSVGDDGLAGLITVTASTPSKRNHVHQRVSFEDDDDDVYSSNIQIAELNALNAAFAVIKWKKMSGFYSDRNEKYFTTFCLEGGILVNEDA